MNTVVPGFFETNIAEAHEKRIKPKEEKDYVVMDQKMYDLLKTFRISRQGNKKGGLHLMRQGAKKRRRKDLGPEM